MRVTVTADGDDQAILGLYRWLGEDDELARASSVTVRADAAPPGSMGAGEIIDVVLTHATAIANLAIAYASWRRSQDHKAKVTFTCDGRSVTVQDGSPETIEKIIKELSSAGDAEDEGR